MLLSQSPIGSYDEPSSFRYSWFNSAGPRAAYLCKRQLSIAIFAVLKRATDLIAAAAALLLTAPVFAWCLAASLLTSGPVFRKAPRLGRLGARFHELSFAAFSGPIHRIPVLLNILFGDMSFIGPRPLSPDETTALAWLISRDAVRPGLICSWWIRQRANIDYDDEALVDREYVETASFRGDLGIGLRSLPALFYTEKRAVAPETISLLGIEIHNVTMAETLAWIQNRFSSAAQSRISFVNPHCVNIACVDTQYRGALRSSDLVLADGIGVKLAGKLNGTPIKQNVNGTDLFPRLCSLLTEAHRSIYLLGARPEVLEGVCKWIRANHPALTIAGSRHGYFEESEHAAIAEGIRQSAADVLLVAMGVPAQELWIERNLQQTGVRIAIGVGGLFDFYSQRIPRAPLWMREIGMEWVFRLYQEPGRMWKRYLIGNWSFLLRVLLEHYNLYHPHNAIARGVK